MDPVTAISLAGSIVALVDFSWKLFASTKEIHRSSDGSSESSSTLEEVAKDVMYLNHQLTAPSTAGVIPDQMKNLIKQSKRVADELLDVLNRIRSKSQRRTWASFAQALKTVCAKGHIDELTNRINHLGGQIQTHLLLMLSDKSSQIYSQLGQLIAESKKLQWERADQLGNLIKEVRLISERTYTRVHQQEELLSQKPFSAPVGSDHGDEPGQLSILLAKLAQQVKSTASEHHVLESLSFDNVKARRENVAEAHRSTFEWVFNTSSPMKFDEWLRTGNEIYWVKGKAGSGKSTLMKFIMGHPKTEQYLKLWAGSKKLVTASFFFWHAGTSLQQSQEGLFRSLLYEVMHQCPDLISKVCSSKLSRFEPFRNKAISWTPGELWQAISQLKDQSSVHARFCFFIDGLDEYDGDSADIVGVIDSLRAWPEIKLCISSRPWNEFTDAFSRPSDPDLALELLTKSDVIRYVVDTLTSNPHFEKLDREQLDLVSEIVKKAQGVFLWVVLVVKSLLLGLTNSDRIIDLQKRLQAMPDDLEEYFLHMFNSIEKIYRQQTAEDFAFALGAEEPLSLMTYYFLNEISSAPVSFNKLPSVVTPKELQGMQNVMHRRLGGHCKGLLEDKLVTIDGTENEYAVNFYARKVDLVHLTARSFLKSKDMQALLAKYAAEDFQPMRNICIALVAQLKALDYDALDFDNWLPLNILEDFVFYAEKLRQAKFPRLTTQLYEEISDFVLSYPENFGWKRDPFVSEVSAPYPKNFAWRRGERQFLEFMIHRGEHEFVELCLSKYQSELKAIATELLFCALQPRKWKYQSDPELYPSVIEMLLRNDAQPNAKYKDSTIWGDWIRSTDEGDIREGNKSSQANIGIMNSFLSHGANPHERWYVGGITRPGRSRRETGRASDLYKFPDVVEKQYQTAATKLVLLFGEDEANNMIRKARPKSVFVRFLDWLFWRGPIPAKQLAG